jgi:hypothetical protein
MARGTPPAVPPELAEIYSALLVCAEVKGSTDRVVRLAPTVRTARPERASPRHLVLASTAADWLAAEHAKGLSGTARAAFRAARRAAILARDFEPAYWHRAVLTREECELAYPESCAPANAPPPAYDDPDRRPSACVYDPDVIHRRYPVPIGPGTASDPAPGWRGEVVAGRFRDLWHVQRGMLFTLPFAIAHPSVAPLLAHTRMTIHAAASHRGNRAWFSPGYWAYAWGNTARWTALCAFWETTYRYPLPPEHLHGWAHTATHEAFFEPGRYLVEKRSSPLARFQLKQITAPGHGRYFSGNDWVQVWWSGTTDLYLARSAGG